MGGAFKEFKGSLTPEKCVTHCKTLGFSYAGLQHSFECFCSHERPSFKVSADISDCNAKCDGNKSKICGGGWRLSVYDIHDKRVNYVQKNYVGCYADANSQTRALAAKKAPDSNLTTPELCVGFCYRNGYRYSGVQYRTQCFCADDIDGSTVSEGDCDMDCAGDKRFLCGGAWRNSVYHTSISDESEDGRLVGCFMDSGELRLLSGAHMTLPDTNSPRRCLNMCLQLGFKFAGVEYGIECFCGNRQPEKSKEASENECLSSCPGGKLRRCGGNWRLLIYSTASVTPVPEIIAVPAVGNQVTAVLTRPTSGSGSQPTTLILQPAAGVQQQVIPPATTRRTPTGGPSLQSCVKSQTSLTGKTVCQGEILFEESFNGNSLDVRTWKHEVFMPNIPDYEFVVFDNNPQTSFIRNGRLTIKPSVYDDNFIRRGRLNLEGCTRRPHSEECFREAKTFSILPPVQSARLITKDSFAFKYGKVEVRAKLPAGDWITPEIWLEPKNRLYGPSYTSGRIRIAASLGNRDLTFRGEQIGSTRLESGILLGKEMSFPNWRIRGRKIIRPSEVGWFEDFHNYTLIWTPDNISFMVDGKDKEDLISPNERKLYEIVGFDRSSTWDKGGPIAPFDDEFYISIGVSVGGMREYPDNCISSGRIKPWTNMAVKGLLNFWQDRNNWQPTWDENKSALQIDHITVQAL